MRATVRSVSNKEKTAPLVGLGDALPGTLKLYEADLLKDGSFDEAVKGSDYVIHTASPFLQANEKTDPYVSVLCLTWILGPPLLYIAYSCLFTVGHLKSLSKEDMII